MRSTECGVAHDMTCHPRHRAGGGKINEGGPGSVNMRHRTSPSTDACFAPAVSRSVESKQAKEKDMPLTMGLTGGWGTGVDYLAPCIGSMGF